MLTFPVDKFGFISFYKYHTLKLPVVKSSAFPTPRDFGSSMQHENTRTMTLASWANHEWRVGEENHNRNI